MPKTFYTNETDIPADQKGAYVNKNGRWELSELDAEHPTIIAKTGLETTQKTLRSEIKTLTDQAGELQQKLTVAESKVLSDGMVAVPPAVKELGEAAQVAGLKKTDIAEVSTLKTKVTDYETRDAQNAKKQNAITVLKSIGAKNPEAFFDIKASDNVDFETEGEGESAKHFMVKTVNGTPTRTELTKESFMKDESFKSAIPAMFADGEGGNFWAQGQESGKSGTSKTVFDEIEAEMKEKQKATKPTDNNSVLAALGGNPVASTATN